MSQPAIEVVDAAKVYRIYRHPLDRVWQRLTGTRRCHDVWALRDVSLTIPRGVTYGIIGRNGSGKSTLLQALAGTVTLTSGTLDINGRLSAVLELGAGFNPEFSGLENAYIGGLLAGVSRREMTKRMDAVRAFAAIGDAFDRPIKTYSSGMLARLAFATAINVDAEILLIDEVLAVGDAFFQQRCMRRIRELQAAGCTIVLVTHDYSAVINLCRHAAWLHEGRLVAAGDPERIVRDYLASRTTEDTGGNAAPDAATATLPLTNSLQPVVGIPHIDNRYGTGDGEVIGIEVDSPGVLEPRRSCRVRISARALRPLAHPILGFTMRNRLGDIVAATNTLYDGAGLPPLAPGELLTAEFEFPWPTLAASRYSLSPALADGDLDHHRICDWIDNAIVVETAHPDGRYGWMRLADVRLRVAVSPARAPGMFTDEGAAAPALETHPSE